MDTIIISLTRRQDRREKMRQQMDEMSVTDWKFFDAVDGKTLRVTDEIASMCWKNDFGSNAGAIACFLSHLQVWRNISRPTIILEDDATIVAWEPQKWLARLDTCDLLFLGFLTWKDEQVAYSAAKYVGGTHGYVISPGVARRLVAWFETNGLAHGFDYCLAHCVGNLLIESMLPFAVTAPWVKGHEGDSDIAAAKSGKLDLNANWELFVDQDHMNDDVERCREEKAWLTRPQINAANSLGFLKSVAPGKFNLVAKPGISIWIKKPVRIQVLCNWCSSEALRQELVKMRGKLWTEYQFVSNGHQIDYWLVINGTREFHDPARTIYILLEPWLPIPPNFVAPNIGFWQLTHIPSGTIATKLPRIAIILSEKYSDPGHRFRVDFLRYCEARGLDMFDVYGRENYHHLRSYCGTVGDNKEDVIVRYQYYLAAENHRQLDYVTEKFWEPLLCESLPLYYGATNIEAILPTVTGLVQLTDDFAQNVDKIRSLVFEDHVPWILKMKEWILSERNIFVTIQRKIDERNHKYAGCRGK